MRGQLGRGGVRSSPPPPLIRARGELVLPLARHCARRYDRGRESLEDLGQVASLALVSAADSFDPARGTAFRADTQAALLDPVPEPDQPGSHRFYFFYMGPNRPRPPRD